MLQKVRFLIILLVSAAATAQIATFPATQSFDDPFTEGTDIAFLPDWQGNTVAATNRIFRDVTDFSSDPAAMSIIPTSSFSGDARVHLNLAGQSGMSVSFVAKSMLNGDGTRDAVLTMETSVDGGTTWIGTQLMGSFPNTNQAAFGSYTYTLPAAANGQSDVWVRFYVTRSTTGTSTAAKLVIDDVTIATGGIAVPTLAVVPTSLSFAQVVGTPSAAQAITVSGNNLTEDVVITAPTDYEVSLSETSGFGPSVTLTPTGGTFPSGTVVYVRMNASDEGTTNGTLTLTSSTASASVALSGSALITTLTNPEAFIVTANSEQSIFSEWDAASPAGSRPSNMAFWTHATTDPDLTVQFVEDYNCLYNLTSRSRFNGQGTNGISFVNTGNSQFTGVCDGSDPTQATGSMMANDRVGAVVVSLNTASVATATEITLSWTGRTILKNNRVYGLRMQYRIGNGGGLPNAGWTEFPETAEYVSGEDNTSQTFNTPLPAETFGQPLVQVRWVYYFISGTGSRAQLGLDDIMVAATVLSTPDFEVPSFRLYPNPATAGRVFFGQPETVTVYDVAGKSILKAKDVTELDVTALIPGLYLVRNANGQTAKLVR